jgi:UDP-4-amino-4,6-dideoxy-N-acetyl-beta-L-altrosamine transaminase
MIPYGRQNIDQDDIAAVNNVLQSDWLTQGPMVPRFEQAIANKVGAAHGVAVNSATSALHIACLALKLGSGDYLWTSPNTFVASANCALYCGANVDFVDIDPNTYNMSVKALRAKLEQSARSGKLPKIVIPVHFAGQSCEMIEIHALSLQYGFKIIEDASHAIGGKYKNKLIGNGDYSDITIFSFHPVKMITTGEGGMAMTNHVELAEHMRLLRSHGITREPLQMNNVAQPAWYYEQLELGFNYRMTDIQAALGLSQLGRLDEFVRKRQYIASVYDKELANLPIILPFQHPDTASAFHLYVIQVEDQRTTLDRNDLFTKLRKVGIGVNVHYIPVHMQPYYQTKGFSVNDFPVAESYSNTAISLPIYAMLSECDQATILSTLGHLLDS